MWPKNQIYFIKMIKNSNLLHKNHQKLKLLHKNDQKFTFTAEKWLKIRIYCIKMTKTSNVLHKSVFFEQKTFIPSIVAHAHAWWQVSWTFWKFWRVIGCQEFNCVCKSAPGGHKRRATTPSIFCLASVLWLLSGSPLCRLISTQIDWLFRSSTFHTWQGSTQD